MKKKRILVLTDTLPWGHRSIARAIYSYLKGQEKKESFVVEYAEAKTSAALWNNLYVFIYRYLPLSNKLSLKVMENETIRKMFLEMADDNLPFVKKTVDNYKPDLIISAYFFHSHSLARWKEKEDKKWKLWTVVADPWTLNLFSLVKKADLHLVYDEVCEESTIRYGVDKDKVMKTGWWVRGEMNDPKVQTTEYRRENRRKLGVEDDRPVIFVGGGSLGTNSLIRLLPVLMMVNKKCLVIFNTGTDKLAYSMVSEYLKLFEKLKKNDLVKIKCLGWIENMAEVLSACDIVFGKAGPNFLFDVVACQKPFVAISHIGGQEDGNLELIKEKKLGWIKEKVGQSESFLLKYIDNPAKFQMKFAREIKKEAERNKQSLPKVLERIKKDLF